MWLFVRDEANETWEGTLDELLLQNPDLPEFVSRRLKRLTLNETIRPPIGEEVFCITRLE